MTPVQLQKLGAQALRQLARRQGLRGAEVLPPDHLRIALAAWLADAPPEAEDAGDIDDGPEREEAPAGAPSARGPGVDGLPPALKTETMARLLETQGKRSEAEALRAGLRQQTPVPVADATAAPSPGPAPTLALHANTSQLRVHWRLPQPHGRTPEPEAGDGATWQIELWIWRARGARVTKRIAVDAPEGDHGVERPPDAAFAAAVLGRREGRAGLRPRARTPLWRAEALTHRAPDDPEDAPSASADGVEPLLPAPADP